MGRSAVGLFESRVAFLSALSELPCSALRRWSESAMCGDSVKSKYASVSIARNAGLLLACLRTLTHGVRRQAGIRGESSWAGGTSGRFPMQREARLADSLTVLLRSRLVGTAGESQNHSRALLDCSTEPFAPDATMSQTALFARVAECCPR